jgi:hypothetical protein
VLRFRSSAWSGPQIADHAGLHQERRRDGSKPARRLEGTVVL